MKPAKRILTLFILVTVIIFTSCSGNDDPQIEEEFSEVVMKEFKEKINTLSVPSSLANSNNTYAQQASLQFQSLKTIGQSYATLFTVPANATALKIASKSSNGTKNYTWSANGVTVSYSITEQSDRYTFVYNVTANGIIAKIMDGYQLKDGSSAEAKLYDDNIVVSTIKWFVNGDIAKLEVNVDNDIIVLESNTKDNSGNIKVYENTFLIVEYIWDAEGSGRYKNYINNQTYTW